MGIAENLAQVNERIHRAAAEAGRDIRGIRLVAVSKTKGPDAVREAYAAGQRDFGENYAQELAGKAEALRDLRDIAWHFIGHLQTNKARIVAKHAHVVHTVDSEALARELGKRIAKAGAARSHEFGPEHQTGPGAPVPVLVEVNVGVEAQKAGVSPGDLATVMRAVREQPALALRGLMTMPPAGDLVEARRVFETLVTLRNLHGGPAVLPELSMGMTDDLEVAIACGATMVRVGTAIFGPRG